MTKVLILKSSILGSNSVSNELIDKFAMELSERETDLETTVRDFAVDPIPQLDPDRLAAIMSEPGVRSADQQVMAQFSDGLISELQETELLVIGAPMYNFAIPTGLKAWFDHVARAGVTFRYTESGSVGLLNNKKVLVISTMGGIHKQGDTDHLRPYLKTVLNFLGLDDVSFVSAAGLNLGNEQRQQSIQQAREQLTVIVENLMGHFASTDKNREAA